MKVALLGPKGTYTHQAAKKYFGDKLEPEFYSTIKEIFESKIETKFVPIENSLGGRVTDTIDLLKQTENQITAEVKLPIEHALITHEENIENIKTVKSHPQALTQCKDLIEEHGWTKEETSSTSKAVEQLEPNQAALASKTSAEINKIPILKESVQDTETNVTRFFVLNGEKEKEEKTSIILEPGKDRAGLLHSMLSCFAGHQINLSHIQSRPTKTKLGDYYFYVEAEVNNGKLEKAVKCLKTYSKVQILGKYTVKQ